MAAINYSKISLQKNGAVTNLVGYKSLNFQQQFPVTPGGIKQYGTDVIPVFPDIGKALNDAVNSVFSNINTTLSLHEIDIIVAILGLVIIVTAVSSILRPVV